VYDVRCPEQAAFMAHSMEPVVAEFIREKEQHPYPPLQAQSEYPEAIEQTKNHKLHCLGDEAHSHAPQPHSDAGGRIFDLVEIAPHDGVRNCLGQHQQYKYRDRQMDQVRDDRNRQILAELLKRRVVSATAALLCAHWLELQPR